MVDQQFGGLLDQDVLVGSVEEHDQLLVVIFILAEPVSISQLAHFVFDAVVESIFSDLPALP